jgi:hypothetical protein
MDALQHVQFSSQRKTSFLSQKTAVVQTMVLASALANSFSTRLKTARGKIISRVDRPRAALFCGDF